MNQRIVCAAIKFASIGKEYIVTGARHYDSIMASTIKLLPQGTYEREQGFIDQAGKFLTREEAWVIAEAAGQIIRRVGGDGNKLYSENLY